jgi:hypothetical protein
MWTQNIASCKRKLYVGVDWALEEKLKRFERTTTLSIRAEAGSLENYG